MQVVGTEEALTLMEQVCVHGISTGSRLTEKRNLSETLDRQLLLRTSSKLTYELKIIYFTWIYNWHSISNKNLFHFVITMYKFNFIDFIYLNICNGILKLWCYSFLLQADPLFLLVGLPTIPILLILGRLVHWEEALLKFLNRTIPRFPVFKYILPSFRLPVVAAPSQGVEIPPLSDPVSATRVVCGAIVFPSMAVLLGKLLFNPAQSSLKRAFLVSFFNGAPFSLVETSSSYEKLRPAYELIPIKQAQIWNDEIE